MIFARLEHDDSMPTPPKKKETRPPTPLTIPASWTWYSHSPLRGLGLAKEKLQLFAWDDSGHVYLLDIQGKVVAERRLPGDIVGVARADTGERLVAISKDGRLWWLDDKLDALADVSLHIDAVAVAIDPHGDYAAVSAQGSRLFIVSRLPKIIANVSSSQTYRYLAFVPATGRIIAVAEQGTVACHDLRGTLIWKETMYSSVGALAVDGSGETIVLAAYGHGLLRYDGNGHREGTYHIEHSPNLVAVEVDGTRLIAASIDGYLTAFDYEGTVQIDRKFGTKASALAMDALGRFLVLGFESGEIRFLSRETLSASQASSVEEGSDLTSVTTRPDDLLGEEGAAWKAEIATSPDEGTSTVLQPLGSTGQIAVYTSRKTLRVYDANGKLHHESPRLDGLGRTLHANDTSVIAATDRRLLAYDGKTNTSLLASSDLYDISHFFALKSPSEVIVVESCDQISRLRLPNETLWKHRLPMRISSIAIDDEERMALVMEDHQLVVIDSAGKPIGRYKNRKPVPMLVSERPGGWVTASIGEQLLRGHAHDGSTIWEEALSWDPWSIQSICNQTVVTSSSGQSMLVSAEGEVVFESHEPREGAIYFPLNRKTVGRAYLSGQAVIIATFEGKLLWRRTFDGLPSTFTAYSRMLWGVVGRSLLSFSFPKSERTPR